uniref:G-protein coupled receptors family 2 profile 2 domain-containing protein n=1 Tax=Sphenodon punctatus TaxID=8508 RepID=A0A8D0GQH6_SPHPU
FLIGFPAIVVTITGSINSYGTYAFVDISNQTTLSLCWIRKEYQLVHYITNCGYFSLIFFFNATVLAVVAGKIFCLQSTIAGKEEKTQAWKGGITVLGLSCLLGATWGLIFFAYNPMPVPALYLFTIVNSLQGLFIFIWFAALYYPKKSATAPATSFGTAKNERVTTASHSS